jgi:hypothetical protein
MVPKLYDLAAADEDQRSYAIEPVRLPVNSTALTKLSAMDRYAEFDAQRRRLNRPCRAAALRNPSILADALLLLFDGACITAPSVGGRIGLSFRFFLGSEAMVAAHAKAPSARRQVQHP